jgi:hypothetical protein
MISASNLRLAGFVSSRRIRFAVLPIFHLTKSRVRTARPTLSHLRRFLATRIGRADGPTATSPVKGWAVLGLRAIVARGFEGVKLVATPEGQSSIILLAHTFPRYLAEIWIP